MFTLRRSPTRTTHNRQQSSDNYLFTAPLQLAARVSLYAMLIGAFGSNREISNTKPRTRHPRHSC
ncbi:hypothetical protein QU487_05835 [Crenobacter sp. SG2305]|uniref:hypothetical protein n=1 Tax=Crenobacter oryzisoli TaxID=3056844 RepID=UPI0025AB23AB|nr:hypothetical protein [Crenobacter sp. SG2305]MDN0082273.1 hypothetical protein [Crenobacter sp. SG2305]